MTANARRPLFTKEATLTRTQSTATKLFDLPRWARIEEVLVISSAAAAGATIDLGTKSDADHYVDAQSVASVGVNRPATTGNTYATLARTQGIYGAIGGTPVAGGPFRIVFVCTSDRLKGNT